MRFVVVDLEATCWSAGVDPWRSAHQHEISEIIEIGAVMLGPGHQPAGEFQRFVRPQRCPTLSDFCTTLTTITQADVDAADAFAEVYADFVQWMGGTAGVGLVSWSRYDHRQLVAESAAAGLEAPAWQSIDAKEEFSAWVRGQTGQRHRYGMGLALAHLGIEPVGTAHRGIDDARNLVSIFQHIRDPRHRSEHASRALAVLQERHPRPAHVGHLRARWPDARRWYPRTSQELIRLGLAVDAGEGRGLTLTDLGRSLG